MPIREPPRIMIDPPRLIRKAAPKPSPVQETTTDSPPKKKLPVARPLAVKGKKPSPVQQKKIPVSAPQMLEQHKVVQQAIQQLQHPVMQQQIQKPEIIDDSVLMKKP